MVVPRPASQYAQPLLALQQERALVTSTAAHVTESYGPSTELGSPKYTAMTTNLLRYAGKIPVMVHTKPFSAVQT